MRDEELTEGETPRSRTDPYERSYRLGRWGEKVWVQTLLYGSILGIAVSAVSIKGGVHATTLVASAITGIIFIPIFGWATLWLPYRIETDRPSLRFIAHRRVVEAGWTDIESVRSPRSRYGRIMLIWKIADGRKIRTPRNFDGVEELAAQVHTRSRPDRLEI